MTVNAIHCVNVSKWVVFYVSLKSSNFWQKLVLTFDCNIGNVNPEH